MKVFSILMLFVSGITVICASHAAHADGYNPHFGNVEIKTCEDYRALQGYSHVYGSVIISGRMMLCDERLENLDIGNVKYISGFLYITLNPYLKTVDASELLHASYIVFSGNPMLTTEESDAIGNHVHCGGGVSCIESGHYSEQLGAQ
jgi:hypothetical protein